MTSSNLKEPPGTSATVLIIVTNTIGTFTRQKWLSTGNRGDPTAATGTKTPAAADTSTFDHIAMHATLSNALSMVAGYEDETLADCIGQMISANAQQL